MQFCITCIIKGHVFIQGDYYHATCAAAAPRIDFIVQISSER